MENIYCDKWSMVKQKPWKLIDVDNAYIFHTNKKPYSVIVKKDNQITNIIELTDKYISVNFMNNFLKPYLCYVFDIKKNDNIFLKTAYYTSYDLETNNELIKMTYSFNENGYIVMEKRNNKTGEIEERELQNDTSLNWDKFPSFGKYEYLLKEER